MNLKNYTSSVPVGRTIARIEELLAAAGASNISKQYRDGKLSTLTFSIETPNGKEITFRMPADSARVFDFMWKEISRPRAGTKQALQEQAERTAWKLLQDSLEVEISRLKLQQVEPLQIFLPYVWDGEKTFYERLKGSGFKQLPERAT